MNVSDFNNKYIKEIKAYDKLNKKQEYDLFEKYKAGDEDAFNRLVECNLNNIYNLTINFFRKNSMVAFDELIAENNLCLVKCVKHFDHTKGYRLYSYLSTAIMYSMVKLINKHKTIRLPGNIYDKIGKMSMGKIEPDLDFHLYANTKYDVISNFHNDDDDNPRVDIADEDIENFLENKELGKAIDKAIDYLTVEECFVISKYFGLNSQPRMKLKDIAIALGCSCSKVNVLKRRALNRLQIGLENFL